ncbi:hypothetical protein HD806DRAFT_533382 [Xylariaceae sp. AK1471]|nr:hypothetical protein HD806DRAFT_533382 [Xylariaceae sp. AK1471]
MVHVAIKAMRLPGFAFGKAAPISDQQLASRFYDAVIGPTDGVELEELRARVDKRMKQIFGICLQQREFYLAVRGSGVFWSVASEHWDTLEHVEANEVAAFVEIYRVARQKCDSSRPTGELSSFVDDFIEMYNATMKLGAAQQFQIALRPSDTSEAAIGLANLSIHNSSAAGTGTWPPSHYTEQEVAWFAHEHVMPQVYGLTPEKKPTKAEDVPRVPNAYTHPLDVRLFLAFAALTTFRSDRKVSLCMTPITFWDDDERKDWYLATGGASKLCWTTWDFCHWAKAEFDRGQEAVVGLCHFHCVNQDPPWKCVGVLIRKRVPGEYEFVMEDAHYHRVSRNPKYYEEKYDLYANDGMDFKSALLEDVTTHFKITSFWHGGEIPNAFADLGIQLEDSVSTSCSFVYHAVKGAVPWDLNRKGWNLSRNIPDKMQHVIKEGEEDDGDEEDDEDEEDGEADDKDDDAADSDYEPDQDYDE